MKSLIPELRELSTQQTDECVVWPYTCFIHFGYGIITYKGKRSKTHRVAWMLEHGDITEEICVLHKCDNPPCINLRHLFDGTKGDNNRDRHEKGRSGGFASIYYQ